MKYQERKNYALKLIKDDNYVEAINEFSKLFKENPEDKDNIEHFIFLFDRINKGNYDFKPENAEQYIMRGVSKFYHQEIAESIEDYNKAFQLNNTSHYALKCKAFSQKFLGQNSNAIATLNMAVKIEPKGEYFDDLAEIHYTIGEMDLALHFHQLAVEHSPNDARLWYNYGVDLQENRNYEEALIKYNKAIEIWPKYEDALYNKRLLLGFLERNK